MVFKNKKTEVSALRRDLKARHLTMITIGGSIGTGLFILSGSTISLVGPGGALFSYILIGLMICFLMTSLGELTAYMPVSGSFSVYGQKYVEEGFGFALGWNYWYSWAITIAVDLVSVQLVMNWWFPNITGWIWSALFLTVIFLLNHVSVRNFGEAEYWFSLIKISSVVIFIVVGLAMAVGVLRSPVKSPVWSNWITGNMPLSGSLSSIADAAVIIGFSFQGTELIGIAAGESENPGKDIPRAIRQVFWRVFLFYVFTIFIIGLIVPHTDPSLLLNSLNNNLNANVSPFTSVFRHAGLFSAAEMMNVVILVSILSSSNSSMYASTRMLYILACDGKAPSIFSKLSHGGVPYNALYATALIASLCLLSSIFNSQMIYLCLLNTSSVTGFIAWLGIAVSHYRFRRGYILQGNDINKLPYHSCFFPLGPVFVFIMCLIITFGCNYKVFLVETVNWNIVAMTYIGILMFLFIWFGYKLIKGTHFIRYDKMEFPDHFKK